MGTRVKQTPANLADVGSGTTGTEVQDNTIEQRETTFDGQTFHWGPNQVRNFLDEGIAHGHVAFRGGVTTTNPVQLDPTVTGKSSF